MIVGEAEILIVANSKGFEESLRGESAGAFSGLSNDAEIAGSDAGGALGSGMGRKIEEEDPGKSIDKSVEKGVKGAEGHGGKLAELLGGLGVPAELTSGYVGLGIAVGGVALASIDFGVKMQSADASIATSAGISTKAATNIGNAFLGTAFKTEFGGKQMAEAYSQVAGQLGATEGHALTAKEALSVMNASAELATASGTDLATSTTTVAGIMQAFQLPVRDAAGATNVLFSAARMTGVGIDTIGASMEKVRAKMGALAPPLGEMGGLLVDLTNHGETGRVALSALGTMFTGLLPPVGKMTQAQQLVVETQKELGVHFTDAAGKLLPFGDIIAEVEPKIKGMSDATAVATLQSLGFGSASAKLVTTIQSGQAVYDKAVAQVTKTGSVHDAAAAKSHTLGVEITTLKSGFGDLMTMLGEKLIPVAQKVLTWFTNLVQEVIKDWPQISATIKQVWTVVEPIFQNLWNEVKMVWSVFVDLIEFVVNIFEGKWGAAWKDVEKAFSAVWTYMGQMVELGVEFIGRAFGKLPSAVYNDVIKPIIRFFEGLPAEIAHGIEHGAGDVLHAFEHLIPGGGLIGGLLSHIHIPFLAEGGIVTKPTLAMIGEAGPEAVIPLKNHNIAKDGIAALPTGGSASAVSASTGSGIGTVNVYVAKAHATSTEIVRELGWALKTGHLAVSR